MSRAVTQAVAPRRGGGARETGTQNGGSFFARLLRDMRMNRCIYLMAIPILVYFILFHYIPMGGAVIAFMDYVPAKGILASKWVGFDNFISFFTSFQFGRLLKNTILLSLLQLIWGFPLPILLALLINEVHSPRFKKGVQTISYMPHFISLVVICGIIQDFTSSEGVITQLFSLFGGPDSNLLLKPELFRTIYVASGVWQECGWGSIIYLSAMSAIDPGLYEAALIDGANRFKQLVHITIPCILPTIVILFIMRMGNVMSLGFEKVILLYNPNIYETADIISSYVYRRGLVEFDYSFSSAVGLFNSVINFALLVTVNRISSKVSEISLW